MVIKAIGKNFRKITCRKNVNRILLSSEESDVPLGSQETQNLPGEFSTTLRFHTYNLKILLNQIESDDNTRRMSNVSYGEMQSVRIKCSGQFEEVKIPGPDCTSVVSK